MYKDKNGKLLEIVDKIELIETASSGKTAILKGTVGTLESISGVPFFVVRKGNKVIKTILLSKIDFSKVVRIAR